MNKVDLSKLESPVILPQTQKYSYRDPAAYYHNGICYLYFTLVEECEDGQYFYVALSKSSDFIHWSKERILTKKDRSKNYSSPGNILNFNDHYYLCVQTYCRENGEIYGNDNSRIYLMETEDLENFKDPELIYVKGKDISEKDMGRMIDPYLLEDKDEAGKYWCFFKQNGVSFSYSYNLKDWTFVGHTSCGENVCVLKQKNEYVIFHSPEDGIELLKSKDLKEFRPAGKIPIKKEYFPWAAHRLTGGFVLDLTEVEEIGVYILFYHGDNEEQYLFGASIAMAYSYDLMYWNAFEEDQATYPEFGKIYEGDYFKDLPFAEYLTDHGTIPVGDNVFDIRDYGAVHKKGRLNTAAFMAASLACRLAGGGTILVQGGEYCMGSISIYDNTTLYITPDAAIIASRDCSRFQGAFLTAEGSNNITITGGGKIYGSGEWYVYEAREKPLLQPMEFSHLPSRGTDLLELPKDSLRYNYRVRIRYAGDNYREGLAEIKRPAFMVHIKQCKNVVIENINLEDAMSWTLNLDTCDRVLVKDIVINNNRHVANTDGIDITGSSNVVIDHCFVSTADDGIVIKNPMHTKKELKNVIIKNCTVSTVMNSFKIGTETYHDIKDILVEDCHFLLPDIYPGTCSGIAIESADGTKICNVIVRNIKMEKVTCPIFICLNRRNRYGLPYSNQVTNKYWGGDITGILIENMKASDAQVPSLVTGFTDRMEDGSMIRKPISHLMIKDVHVTYKNDKEIVQIPEVIEEFLQEYPENNNFGDVDAYGIWMRHVDFVKIDKVEVVPRDMNTRECFKFYDSKV